jgi:hypothetical protein
MKTKNKSQVQSRRRFLGNMVGATGGMAAATMALPSRVHAAWPPGETPEYKGRSNVEDAYEMYTHSEYWGEEDVTWWEGRRVRVGGIAIGVIQLSANIPMIPGNMGNASTFDFPLMYEPMEVTGTVVSSRITNNRLLRSWKCHSSLPVCCRFP